MAKRVVTTIKLNMPAGKATLAPPLGPVLGQAGINMMEFLKKFNEMSSPQMGFVLPVEITVYEDKSYAFQIKQPLMTELIKRAAGITSHSKPNRNSSEGRLDREEGAIPTLAAKATAEAFQLAQRAGLDVLIAENGNLVSVAPDGTKKVIRTLH